MRTKAKIFILAILSFLTCTGGCHNPLYHKPGQGVHKEFSLDQSHIPMNVVLDLQGEYLNNSEAAKQLESGIMRLGFNLVEEQKKEAVFVGLCVVNVYGWLPRTKDYYVQMNLNDKKNDLIWVGWFYGSSIRQSTDEVLGLLEKDIKLFNTKKLEGSGPK